MKKVCWNNVPTLFPETVRHLQYKIYSEDLDSPMESPEFYRDRGFQLKLQ